jgi:photosystem II stability/assembly factor-like uncharacterized protein
MKRLSTIIAFLFVVACAYGQTAQRWQKVALPSPYNTGYYLDIFFLPGNSNYGWACDQNGGYVVRTSDGGATWQGTKVDPALGACHLEYIQFLDQNVGYCSGPGGMYKSVDGGNTWTNIKPPGSPVVWGGWFKNAAEGWFVGGGCGTSTFLRTVDGGATFTTFVHPEPRSVMSDPYWDASMPANTLYAIGSGTLFRSQDNGTTWDILNYTGTNAPWHEELAMFNNSVLVPNSGRRCGSLAGPTDGMRYSTDLGATWRDFQTGEDMFGTFLHDTQRGWAAGWAAAVYYTSNAGQTWQPRTCGLDGAGTDDIFFIDDNNGWVVGDGIFRTAPALRTQNKTLVKFTGVCPDSVVRDTVRFRNRNWFSSPWSVVLNGVDAAQFRIVNAPIGATISSCDSIGVIVEYRPNSQGPHSATIVASFQQPDTVLVVELEGSGRQRTANPVDTLIAFNAPVGVPTSRSSVWRSSASTALESIVSIIRISGDTTISLTVAQMPAVVRTDGTLTYITANPRDTGWTQAKFRVRLGPCQRDTVITVRVYGVSPIFTSIPNAYTQTGCGGSDTIEIPVLNTANAPLNIGAISIDMNASTAFTFMGMKSGRTGIPWVVPIGGRDTLLVLYRSGTGKDNSSLTIQHNDLTKARGSKNPWTITLRGVTDQPSVTISPRTIDIGSVCVGAVVERNINITNIGTNVVDVNAWTTSANITGIPQGKISLSAGQVRQIPMTFTASKQGAFVDTVYVRISPCDSTHLVIVKGTVENIEVTITPSRIADSADVSVPLSGRCVIKLRTGDSAMITSIRISPLPQNLTYLLPSLPVKLRKGDSIVVDLNWSSPTPATYSGSIEVTASTTCVARESSQIYFRALNADVGIGPGTLNWLVECKPTESTKQVLVEVRGNRPVRVFSASIVEQGAPFRIVGPPTPFVVDPGKPIAIDVAFTPSAFGRSSATMQVDTDVDGGDATLNLEGVVDNVQLVVTPKLLDAGSALPCSPLIRKEFTIQNNGSVSTVVDISDTRAPLGFTVTPKTVNLGPGGKATIFVDIQPSLLPVNKVSYGQFYLQDRLCNDVDTVTAMIDIGDVPKIVVNPDPLVLPEILKGEVSSGTITVSNPSMYDLFIRNVRVQQVRPHWTLLTPLMGRTLASGESITVDAEYAPIVPGQDSAQVFIEAQVVSGPTCTSTTTTSLVGSAKSPRVPVTYDVKLRVDEYKVGPEAIVEIPVHLDSDIKDAQPDSIMWSIGFSQLNLTVDSVFSGSAPDARVVAKIQPTQVSFTAYPTGAQFGKPGVLAVMFATAHAAIPDSTPLDIKGMFATAYEPLTFTDDDGYVIIDACGPRFWINYSQRTIFRLNPPLPVRDALSIHSQSQSLDVAIIDIVNSLGQIVRSVTVGNIQQGASTIRVDMTDLADGVYVIRLVSQSGGVLTATVPLSR